MPDYGHRLEFGYFLSLDAGDPDGRRRRSTCSARQIGIWRGAARHAGRDPRDIRRIYNVPGAFGAAAPGPAGDTDQAIAGPPDRWAEVLTHFALDLGFGTFILTTPPEPDTLRAFIDEVAPQVRERVGTARASAAAVPITGQR